MAFRTQKISQMTPKGANLEATDLIEVSTIESGSYVTRSITGQEIIDAAVGNVDWGDIGGTLSAQTDLQNALDAKVPTSRTLTINGVTQDLSANRTFTISTGITIGSTAIASGVVGRVLFEGAGNVVQQSSSLFWDNTNERLGIGTSSPTAPLTIKFTGQTGQDFYISGSGSNTHNIGGGNTLNIVHPNITAGASFGTAYGSVNRYFSIGSSSNLNARLAVLGGGTTSATSSFLVLNNSSTELFRIRDNGNIGINTTTDAGFKLDVNGTARVQSTLTLGGEIFGATNTYFNGPSLNTGTLWLRFNAVNSNGNFTVTGPIQGTNVIASGNNSQLSSTGAGVQGIVISNTATSTNWRIEGHRTTSGALEFKNDLTNPVLNLFSTRNVGIGTFTDAGFRLDVNGTARFSDNLLLTNGIIATSGATTRLQSSLNYFTHNRIASSGVFGFQISSYGTAASFWRFADSTYDTEIGNPGGAFSGGLRLFTAGTERMQITIGGLVLVGTTTAVSSSQFTIESTTRGFLPPRMTTTQKNAIASPAAGLMVYDTTLNVISYYNGSMWI